MTDSNKIATILMLVPPSLYIVWGCGLVGVQVAFTVVILTRVLKVWGINDRT